MKNKHSGHSKRVSVRLILLIVALATVCNYVGLRLSIAAKDREIQEIRLKIREQKLINEEYASILSDENIDDLFKVIALENLGYGYRDEKIYRKSTN